MIFITPLALLSLKTAVTSTVRRTLTLLSSSQVSFVTRTTTYFNEMVKNSVKISVKFCKKYSANELQRNTAN